MPESNIYPINSTILSPEFVDALNNWIANTKISPNEALGMLTRNLARIEHLPTTLGLSLDPTGMIKSFRYHCITHPARLTH